MWTIIVIIDSSKRHIPLQESTMSPNCTHPRKTQTIKSFSSQWWYDDLDSDCANQSSWKKKPKQKSDKLTIQKDVCTFILRYCSVGSREISAWNRIVPKTYRHYVANNDRKPSMTRLITALRSNRYTSRVLFTDHSYIIFLLYYNNYHNHQKRPFCRKWATTHHVVYNDEKRGGGGERERERDQWRAR